MAVWQQQLSRYRSGLQAGFFILFVVAPPLDMFRYDLTLGHFIVFGMPWTLGLDGLASGDISATGAVVNVMLRGFLPLLLVGGTLIWTAWRFGRLYCGWLCPHFSVVETVNALLQRASGKPSVWEARPLPVRQPDGRVVLPDARYWPVTVMVAGVFAFIWALSLLTYLLPPFEIYHNLLNANLSANQARFLGVATLLFFIDFMFARHLFCRFGCAVGLFQSLAWMANPRALVVGFDRSRARRCQSCNNACDNACPMRLRPRTIKRHMFTCTECTQCISACEQVQADNPAGSLLHWVAGEQAVAVADGRPAAPRSSKPATEY